MQPDDTICYCFHVSKRKITNYLRLHRLKRPSQLSECNGAGTGCGWCVPYLQRFFDESQSTGTEHLATICSDLTPAEYARQRADYIAAGKVRRNSGASDSSTLPKTNPE